MAGVYTVWVSGSGVRVARCNLVWYGSLLNSLLLIRLLNPQATWQTQSLNPRTPTRCLKPLVLPNLKP